MNRQTYSQTADAAHRMCKLRGDSMLDNADRTFAFEFLFDSEAQAQEHLAYYTLKAREVESEPCQIESEIRHTENGWLLAARFEFCCEAEVILFQLAAR